MKKFLKNIARVALLPVSKTAAAVSIAADVVMVLYALLEEPEETPHE